MIEGENASFRRDALDALAEEGDRVLVSPEGAEALCGLLIEGEDVLFRRDALDALAEEGDRVLVSPEGDKHSGVVQPSRCGGVVTRRTGSVGERVL